MLTYLEEEFDERWDASRQTGETNYSWNGIERTEVLPKWLGQGRLHLTELPNGIWIQVSQEAYTAPFKQIRIHPSRFSLTGKFYLSGQICVKTEGIANEYVEAEGHNYLYCLPKTEEVEAYQNDKSTDFVMIWVTPAYLKTFVGGQLEGLAPELQQFASSRTRPFFHRSLGKNTPAMQVTLHQMINCPYHGLVRRMFLESRATELLALQFAQWNLMESATLTEQSDSLLRTDDIDRLNCARDILEQRMEEPPSLLELARLVGLNDCKLKEGFRQVFGTTVFGYLRSHRLEKARQLLSTDTMSVTEVAYTVGFSNRGYFASAFRSKFGINPREYLAEQRRYRQFF